MFTFISTLIRIIIWVLIGLFAAIGFTLCLPIFILCIIFVSSKLGYLISKYKQKKPC